MCSILVPAPGVMPQSSGLSESVWSSVQQMGCLTVAVDSALRVRLSRSSTCEQGHQCSMAAPCFKMAHVVQADFVELEKVALSRPDPIEDLPSGQAELYEIVLSRYIR